MTSALSPPTGAPPADPVHRAAADPQVRAELARHAAARLLVRLRGRAGASRPDLVEEVVQETFKRAVVRAAEYCPERGTMAGWLHGILEHVVAEQCRQVRKQPAQATADPATWEAVAVRLDPGGSEKSRRELDELLAGLEPENRRIITLHHLDGLSHADIAARLGISPAASRTRLARAMNALRELAARKEGGR